MVTYACRLLSAKAKKCFLNDFPRSVEIPEDPVCVTDKMTFVLVQRGHDPCGFRRVFHPSLSSSNVRKARLLDMGDDLFVHWFEALQRRHLEKLSFPEVRRAVQALSSLYVERRGRIDTGAAFSGAGKRAAFAMYFSPLHFLLVREVVRALAAQVPRDAAILDLGCGTGVAGVAWSLELDVPACLIGVDRNRWVLEECRWTYQQFGLKGSVRSVKIRPTDIPPDSAIIAAFTLNELDTESRDAFRQTFIKTARSGAPVLIVEPIARSFVSWWDDWAHEWTALGGRHDEWRFRLDLPQNLALMDKAAGLDHRELTGRSLWLPALA